MSNYEGFSLKSSRKHFQEERERKKVNLPNGLKQKIKARQERRNTPLLEKMKATFSNCSIEKDGFLFVKKSDMTETNKNTLFFHKSKNQNLNIIEYNNDYYRIEIKKNG